MADDIKIINADEAESIDPELPDAGWQRDEELAKRKDDLQQAAEEATEEREVYGFDPSKFDPDRDILQNINELEVENAQPGTRYFWCYEGQNGRFVTIATRIGWRVVQGSDPECPTLKDARGYRKIGDTILLKATEEHYRKIERSREYKALVQKEGVKGALRELGEKYRSKGFVVHDDASNVQVGRKGSNLMDVMESKAKRAGALDTAMKGVDRHLREGTVPGMPAPGKERG